MMRRATALHHVQMLQSNRDARDAIRYRIGMRGAGGLFGIRSHDA